MEVQILNFCSKKLLWTNGDVIELSAFIVVFLVASLLSLRGSIYFPAYLVSPVFREY